MHSWFVWKEASLQYDLCESARLSFLFLIKIYPSLHIQSPSLKKAGAFAVSKLLDNSQCTASCTPRESCSRWWHPCRVRWRTPPTLASVRPTDPPCKQLKCIFPNPLFRIKMVKLLPQSRRSHETTWDNETCQEVYTGKADSELVENDLNITIKTVVLEVVHQCIVLDGPEELRHR